MNTKNITLKQLRIFSTIARAGSLTLAAEQLFITKAAASMALQELERQLDTRLFDRLNNRLILNSQGEILRPLAEEVLQRVDAIAVELGSNASNQPPLRIGASNTIGNHLLPALLGDFLRSHPCRRPQVVISNTSQLSQQLEQYELDIALVEGSFQSDQLDSENWLRDRMEIVANPHHPLANGEIHAIEALEAEYWVLREFNSGTREQFQTALAPKLNNWQIGLELNTNEAIINAISAGLGLGYMSILAINNAVSQNQLAIIRTRNVSQRQLRIVTHRQKYHSPLLNQFIEFCRFWSPN
ncbi:LysR family transcriptional regulator [Marinobacterium jannaschii]|uniref:LysR family transcriptional regulator n=1 Tax=Marinobacterium jannaschii TaxID=64970 RepID=UPI000489BC8E|nr:LysR family transcriptional regulator [Marinobacterium jannaschii]